MQNFTLLRRSKSVNGLFLGSYQKLTNITFLIESSEFHMNLKDKNEFEIVFILFMRTDFRNDLPF